MINPLPGGYVQVRTTVQERRDLMTAHRGRRLRHESCGARIWENERDAHKCWADGRAETRVWFDRGANGWRTFISEPIVGGGSTIETEIFETEKDARTYVSDFWVDWNAKHGTTVADGRG